MNESRLKSESRIQSECYQWFYNTYPQFRGLLFHVPNQLTSNNAFSGAINKGTGIYPGVSDFVGICPVSAANLDNSFYSYLSRFVNFVTGMYLPLFFAIEMKTPTGKQSPAQKKWEKHVCSFGVKYYLCSSLEQFKQIIQDLYGSPSANINTSNW